MTFHETEKHIHGSINTIYPPHAHLSHRTIGQTPLLFPNIPELLFPPKNPNREHPENTHRIERTDRYHTPRMDPSSDRDGRRHQRVSSSSSPDNSDQVREALSAIAKRRDLPGNVRFVAHQAV